MNLKNKALLVVGLYLFLSLIGCKSGEFLEPRQNVALAKGIRQAMSKDQVLIVMKEPPISIDYSRMLWNGTTAIATHGMVARTNSLLFIL